MTAASRFQDEYTLLCERCGYVIEGLPTDASCPECSRPIALSLPELRVGTPWQQRPRVRSLILTWWRTVRHPLRTLDTLRLDEIRLFGAVVPTLLLCSVVCWVVACVLEIPTLDRPWQLAVAGVVYAVFATVFAIALLLVSGLAALGLQIISGLRGTRVTPEIAWHIVGLASVGWVACYAVWLAGWSGAEIYRIVDPPLTDYELRRRVAFELDSIYLPAFVGGFGTGLLVFVGYALLGCYRLRYANRVRPQPDGEAVDGAGPAVPIPDPASPGATPAGLPRIGQ